MRHRKSKYYLGRKASHRRAMFRNMVVSVILHEQITTTCIKAKAMRPFLEKMISLAAKRGDTLANRRRALKLLPNQAAVCKLFGELSVRYAARPGGYCRILKRSQLRADSTKMATIQLLGASESVEVLEDTQ